MVCLSADQFAVNLVESSGDDVKRPRLEGRSGILTWKCILKYPDQLWNRVETRECRKERHRWKFPQYLHLHLRQKNTCLKCEDKECTRKQSGSEHSGVGRTPGCPACKTPGLGKSHARECKSYLDAWNESRRGGETRNCWRSGHTTAGPEFEFN